MNKMHIALIGSLGLYCIASSIDYYEARRFDEFLNLSRECRKEIKTHNANKISCHNLNITYLETKQ